MARMATRQASINITSTDNGFIVQGAGKQLVSTSEKEVPGLVADVLKEIMKTGPPYGIAEPPKAEQSKKSA
jgi:hypothetical protein